MESWLKLFFGFLLVGYGIWLLVEVFKEMRSGYPDRYGNNIGLFFGAIMCIILGMVLIYQEGFVNINN